MKLSKILIYLCVVLTFGSYAMDDQSSDQGLYSFGPVVKAPEKSEVTPSNTTDKVTATESSTATPSAPSVAVNVVSDDRDASEIKADTLSDAQALIRDKMIEKYQLRVDESINKINEKLSKASAEERATILSDTKEKVTEKRKIIAEKKTLDPLKKDITLAILDHLLLRIQGLIDQKAQTPTRSAVSA